MKMLPVIAVHGVGAGTGRERAGFSRELDNLVYKDDPSSHIWNECVWEDLNDAIDDRVGGIVKELLGSYRLPWKLDAPSRWDRICQGAKILCTNIALHIGGDYLTQGLDLGSDFLLYLDSDHGQKIRNRLKGEILELASKHPEGIALVAHSLGSVIAYDVLAEAVCDKNPLPVKQLVTFGSPLAWTFDLRDAEEKDERRFTSIGATKWTNFFYKEDYVPLHRPLPASKFSTVVNQELTLPQGNSQFGSHTAYWKDESFAAEVKKLIEV